ncbi:MAG: hypothetical protein OXT67_12355 [Zetaproteobacteria bacterium]|nr:hypothetical protein [Zetaproteobacteria bacterium]
MPHRRHDWVSLGLVWIILGCSARVSAQAWRDAQVIAAMTGCYQVEYSYTEVESLREGYPLDPRVYDATQRRNIYEWNQPVFVAMDQVEFQRVLVVELPDDEEFHIIKHHGEVWKRKPDYLYHYQAQDTWAPAALETPPDLWLRRVLSLDDGIRYDSMGAWQTTAQGTEWRGSASLSPIPGRESRDMGRSDYQFLYRTTRLLVQPWGFLERQNNIKQFLGEEAQSLVPLAREKGRIYNIRLSEHSTPACYLGKQWASARLPYWRLSRKVWNEVLNGVDTLKIRSKAVDGTPRFAEMWQLEDLHYRDAEKEAEVPRIKALLLAAIAKYMYD